MNDFIIAGIGGQGVLTCSKLILETALYKGYEVRSAETIGMAQRGGSVISHVRIGERIYSSLIPEGRADEVISMDFTEALRYQNYLKQSGYMEAPEDYRKKAPLLKVPLRSDIHLKSYDLKNEWIKCKTRRITNILMLGIVFSSDRYIISHKDIEKTLRTHYSGDLLSKNLLALYAGAELAREGRE